MSSLGQSLAENIIFVLQFLGIVFLMFFIAYSAEKYNRKKNNIKERILNTKKIAVIGMFSAIAAVLHILDFPLPFAPDFYKLDFSELPALIGAFAFGPVAGVMIEFCKILIKLMVKGTSTAFVGDLANFLVGCSFLLPASLIYQFKKSRLTAIVGCAAGTIILVVFGTAFNAIYLLPKFSVLFGMDMNMIIGAGSAINPAINNITTFVIFAVAPLNIIKGGSVSILTLLLYKKLSPILKQNLVN